MDIWDAIYSRRSIRRYQNREVPPDLVWRILHAAHWAPSAHNRQPWRFVVIGRGPRRERLARRMAERLVADLLQDGWEEEAARERANRSIRRLTTAPLLILLALDTDTVDTYEDPRRQQAAYLMMVQSVALAGQNLLLAAHALGLGACWICAPLFAGDIVRDVLDLPPTWEPQGFITVGYPAEQVVKEREDLEERVLGIGYQVLPPQRTSTIHPESTTDTKMSNIQYPTPDTSLALLSGGVGGAKMAAGLYAILPPDTLTVIVNTGDDFEHIGLPISPDLDTVMYTLAGLHHPERGWGLAGDTFQALEMLGRYGAPTWFQLGDKDLATHIVRRHLRDQGWPLSRITDHLRTALGIRARILPMTDDPVRTVIVTPEGPLPFQEYFVHRRQQPPVREVRFQGIESARPAPGVLEALDRARAIVIAPSNPYLSLDPILTLAGVRDLLRRRRERVVMISPIVGGKAVKGPLAKIMREYGEAPSALTVARYYRDILGAFVLDEQDAALKDAIAALGMRVVVTDTLMKSADDRARVARAALEVVEFENE